MTLIIYKLLANCDNTIRRSVRVSHDQFTPKFCAQAIVCMKRSFVIRLSKLKR